MTPYYEHAGITIYHGDCREVLTSLSSVPLIITDPPYGVGIVYGDAEKYDDAADSYWGWFGEVLTLMRASSPQVIFNHRQAAITKLPPWDRLLIWYKPRVHSYAVHGWQSKWEPIFVYGGTVTYRGNPDWKRASRYDAVSILTEKNNTGHPCPKPIALAQWMISTFDGDVCDPFCGSGTTLVAAKELGRRAIGIEIEERYCEIAARRLSQEILPGINP